ncbi:MAG: aminopeptidase, partial [Polyangia bacterium]
MRAVALGALLFSLSGGGCFTGDYLLQQGVGQLALMHERRRISEVLADPAVSADTKRRLALARSARDFGVEVLGLHGGDAYTRFVDTHGAPLA